MCALLPKFLDRLVSSDSVRGFRIDYCDEQLICLLITFNFTSQNGKMLITFRDNFSSFYGLRC